jgi:tRNA modification GTPase
VTAEPASVVACLTPPGRAALATLGLFGPRAWPAARELFRLRSGSPLPERPQAGCFWLGRMGEELADEVVLAVKRADPLPWLEVHGHGGPAVVDMLLDLLAARGLRPCTWQEFLRHTGSDPLASAAAVALAQAPTVRTAAVLLDQQHGALARALAAVDAALQKGEHAGAEKMLAELAGRAALGRHLTQPWRVVVAGAPNVGKSSLVNAIAGYQRSLVAPTPGTTRDVVTTLVAIDGWPVELADTAGLRAQTGTLEEEGIRQARASAAQADLCLWVVDSSTAPVWPDEQMNNTRLVVNKVDLPPAWELGAAGAALRVSAQTGEGLAALCAAVSAWLVPEAPPAGAAVPFSASLAAGVEEALRQMKAGRPEDARATLAGL